MDVRLMIFCYNLIFTYKISVVPKPSTWYACIVYSVYDDDNNLMIICECLRTHGQSLW